MQSWQLSQVWKIKTPNLSIFSTENSELQNGSRRGLDFIALVWQIQGWHQCTAATYCLSQVSFLSRVGAVFKHYPQKVKINLTFELENKIFHFWYGKHNFFGSMFWKSSQTIQWRKLLKRHRSFYFFTCCTVCMMIDAMPFIFVLFISWSYFLRGHVQYAN